LQILIKIVFRMSRTAIERIAQKFPAFLNAFKLLIGTIRILKGCNLSETKDIQPGNKNSHSQKHTQQSWKQQWIKRLRPTLTLLHPKLTGHFYFAGKIK